MIYTVVFICCYVNLDNDNLKSKIQDVTRSPKGDERKTRLTNWTLLYVFALARYSYIFYNFFSILSL